MKQKLILIAVLLVVVIAGGYLYWNQQQQTYAIIAASTPEPPLDQIQHPKLLERIRDAHNEAVDGSDRLAGLQELSRLYHANGFNREAWQCYAGLVALEPDQAIWPYRFARILAGYGQLEEAAPLFRKAVELDPQYLPSRIRLGDTLLKQNRIEEAEAAYQDALERDPDNAYARVGLARVAIAREQWQEAQLQLEQAVATTQFQIGADLLADVYEQLGQESKEQIVLQNIEWGSYADIPDPWSLSLMDDCYDAYQVSVAGGWVAHQGDVQTGLRYIKRAVDLDPDDATLHYQIAGVYLAINQVDDAERHFQRCIEIQPDFADAWLSLIEIAKRGQSPTRVRRAVDQALDAAPDSPSLHIEKAKLLTAQGRGDAAIPYLQRSVELRPHEAIGYIELAQAYMRLDRVDEGMQQMRIALEKEPNNPIALTTMAFDAIMRGDRTAADQWIEKFSLQPRITRDEMSQLATLYQQKFGAAPNF